MGFDFLKQQEEWIQNIIQTDLILISFLVINIVKKNLWDACTPTSVFEFIGGDVYVFLKNQKKNFVKRKNTFFYTY